MQNVLEFIPAQHLSTPREYAQQIWGNDFIHIEYIVSNESGWNPTAQNPTSSAFGLHQFVASTWKSVGCEKTDDPYTQLDCGKKYIEQTYGTAKKAAAFHKTNGWY